MVELDVHTETLCADGELDVHTVHLDTVCMVEHDGRVLDVCTLSI